nr:unnamed protein product [Haemonchus contortus]
MDTAIGHPYELRNLANGVREGRSRSTYIGNTNSTSRYLCDFAPVPEQDEEDFDERTEQDADGEGTYSDYDEEEIGCKLLRIKLLVD